MIQDINGMLPARVIKYDRAANRVQVQLLISLITTSGASVPRAQIASIPVLLLGGGGLFISFPINPGDLGWVIANDRDISNFLSTYSTSIPNTNRISQFSDGLFVPDIMRGYTLASDAAGAMVIQNMDGSVSVAISDTDVTVTAADSVTINAGHNVNINATANSVVTLAGGLGTLGIVGNITATGSITPSTPPPPP
jgi:phage baseplate assembly protein gpV